MLIKKSEIIELSDGIRKAIAGETFDPRDHKEGVMSILKNDIYTLINIEKEQRNSAEQEKEQLSIYLADIAHQLKTPITSMNLMVNLLKDAPEEKQKEFIFHMKRELANMEWMVSALLKMSKIDAGVVEFRRGETNSSSLIREALIPLEILLDINNQSVEIRNDTKINCDQRWTVEALTNILKNASECSKENGIIWVDSGENPIYSWISVTDSGTGIPRERIASLFRRFENSQNENGYGIGLPLALSIMKGQNGDIEIEPG